MKQHINNVLSWDQFLNENNVKINPYIFDNPILVEKIENVIEPSSFICTYVASAVKMLEGDSIKIYGFSVENNPESEYFSNDEDGEGHHFAVMYDRYIIDPWIYNNYYDYETKINFNRSVFDLQNKNDETIIKYIYGNRNKWVDITNKVEDFKDMFPKYNELHDFYNSIKIY